MKRSTLILGWLLALPLAFSTTSAVAQSLTASSVEASTATLTIANYSGNWYYKYTKPAGGHCSSSAVTGTTKNLTGLRTGTYYVFKAYNDSACTTANLLATATEILTKPGRVQFVATWGVSQGIVVGWRRPYVLGTSFDSKVRYRACTATPKTCASNPTWSSWQSVTLAENAVTTTIGSLTTGTAYQVQVAATNDTGTGEWSESYTATPDAAKRVSVTSETGGGHFNIGLVNHTGPWSFQYTTPTKSNPGCVDVNSSIMGFGGLTDSHGTFTFQGFEKHGCSSADKVGPKVTLEAVELTVSAIEALTATLDLAGHTGNWFYKSINPSTSPCSSPVTGSTNLTGLLSNTSFSYRAYQTTCTSNAAGRVTFLTKPGKPTKPKARVSTSTGELILTATVSGSGTLSKWQYKKKEGSGNFDANWTDISSTSTSLSHTVTGLTDGTNYQFKVRARNATGDSVESEVSDAVAPGSVTLSVTAHATDNTKATLTIDNHTGDWYYKYTSPDGGSCSSVVSSGTTTASLTNLSSGTSYTYKAYSNSTCTTANLLATATAYLTKPGKVSNVAAAARNTSLRVTWDSETGATSYKVQWKSGLQNWDSTNRQSTVSGGTAYSITGLTNSTTYTVRVAAKNTSGDGAWSDTTTGTPAAQKPSKPSAPTLTVKNESLGVSWTAPASNGSSITDYDVQYRACTATPKTCASSPSWGSWTDHIHTGTGTTTTISGLTNGTAYQVQVRARNGVGDSAWSASAKGQPVAATLTAGTPTATTNVLTLADHTSAWWYKHTGGNAQCTAVSANTTTVSLTGLTVNTTYTYTAYSDSNCSTGMVIASAGAFTTTNPSLAA